MQDDDQEYYSAMKFADKAYFDVYDMELLAGNGLSESDTLKEVVVNEKLLRYVGHTGTAEEALGTQLKIWGQWVPITGVVKDFHSTSLRNDVSTSAIFSHVKSYRVASIKVSMAAFKSTNSDIEKIWKTLYPEYDYDYAFYDDELAEFYEVEQQIATILTFFSTIAIIVGCLGLFGLASFMVNQKTKEIGVRKTLGATVASIVGRFSWSYAQLILVAFVLSVPVAYYFMDAWLREYRYRIELTADLFLVAFIGTMVIALLTVGYKSVRAAMANPVDSLRDE